MPEVVRRRQQEEGILHLLTLTSDLGLPLEVVEVEGKGRGVKVGLMLVWSNA